MSVIRRDLKLWRVARSFKPDVMAGTSAEITHVGRFLGIPALVVNEDDVQVVPFFAKVAYPLATHILAPSSCSTGKWAPKTIFYEGYHELAYLHPREFAPDPGKTEGLASSRFFLIRFAKLEAHHDKGKRGLSTEIARGLIARLREFGRIVISSERILDPEFEPFRYRGDPANMHHVMSFADLLIADSQTMTAEAAILGTPSIRFNDFVGRIGYLEELEHRYNLTCGIPAGEPSRLFEKINDFLSRPGLKSEAIAKRNLMLKEKINLTEFMTWILEDYSSRARAALADRSISCRFL
jgi:predicted glycosyltransferase